jgi:dihydrofolate reductase
LGKIIISENMSIDGVVQDPTGEEGVRVGGWFGRVDSGDLDAWAEIELEEAMATEALLLGRRTYEFFAARWPSRTGTWADRLNAMPKYVVSATLENPDWNNSVVLAGNVVDKVTALRRKVNGDIVVYGSSGLVHTLIEHNLVDELRLMIFPCVLGTGNRLFGTTSGTKHLRRTATRTVGDGVAFLGYEVVRDG